MKTLYIIAWIGLVLSIVVHVLCIFGPEDFLSDIDAFVWFLHGGAVLLGFALVVCAQKSAVETQREDWWKAVFQNCPLWMRRMVGCFMLYGFINFIIFLMSKSGALKSGGGTPTTVFKGFSGHWMIGYSIETAAFYSCLKKNVSDASKNLFGHPIVSTDCNIDTTTVSKEFAKAAKINIPVQILGVMIGLLILGGGIILNLWLFSCLAYWVIFLFVRLIRPGTPSKSDLLLLRFGIVILFVVAVLVAGMISFLFVGRG
jgi:hypothetical protein